MEHDTNTAPNAPAPRGPGGANLEAYGDWVTVDAGRAASPEPRPRDSAADVDIAHRAPDTRSAQDLTVAEEELLDRLGETESAAAVATPVAGGATPGADTYATNAALAKLERQLSSLSADLKAVGQQLAELRSRGGGAPAVAPEAAGEPPPPPPPPAFAADAGDGPLAITLEELDGDPVAPEEDTESRTPANSGDADPEVTDATQPAVAPPADRGTSAVGDAVDRIELVPDPEPELPAAAPLPAPLAGDTAAAAAAAPATGTPAGTDVSGQVREDVRSVLAYLDQLLDALPPDKVREFAQSEHFATYKKLFKEFDLDD